MSNNNHMDRACRRVDEGKKAAFPFKESKPRKDYITKHTWEQILNRRQILKDIKKREDKLRETEDIDKMEKEQAEITKIKIEEREAKKNIKKAVRKDRENMISNWVREDLNIRDQWAGVKRQKAEYKPRPFERKDKEGKDVKVTQLAEATADYLSTRQWGTNKEEKEQTDNISNRIIRKHKAEYNTDIITIEEIQKAIKQAKNNKVPGPDELEAELFKNLGENAVETIQHILNSWWISGKQEDNILEANVASLYKKGDTKDQENYRPISLLNYIYKLLAHITRERLREGIEK